MQEGRKANGECSRTRTILEGSMQTATSGKRMMLAALALALGLCLPGLAVAGEVVEYFHLDAVGNIRAVTDASGNVIERHDYLPFGDEWCGAGVCGAPTAGQPRRFTGKERDRETGFDYFGARYYSGRVGRFTGVDPVYTWRENLADPQRWNRYAYGLNNPLRYVDPDGRWPTKVKLVHQNAIFRTLSFLPLRQRAILERQQIIADRDQSAGGAFMHAMRGPEQTVAEAKRLANAYVRSEIELARLLDRDGDRDEALRHLGNAIHTLQDATSPAHSGFQEWRDEWGTARSAQGRQHVSQEFYDPGPGSALDRATRRAWDYFVGNRVLPKDFFEAQ